MSENLHGQSVLLDGLVPHWVGLERNGQGLIRSKGRDSGPVVQVIGGRGAGKSALLNALYEAYHNRLPLAHADLAAPGFGHDSLAGLSENETPNSSPVTSLLYLLSDQLGLKVDRFGHGLQFRRLSVGLLVVSAWQPVGITEEAPGRPEGLRAAERRLFEILRADSIDQQRRKEVVEQWLDALLPAVSGAVGVPIGLDPMFQAVARTARELLLAARPDSGALRWWRDQLPMFTGDGLQRLLPFVRGFRGMADWRQKAEALLVAAFLADIDENYGWRRRHNDAPYPLVLLDNLHTPQGARLLTVLLLAYQQLPRTTRHVTRPVIVASSLGDIGADSVTALPDATAATVRPPGGHAGGPQVLRLGLPPVRHEEILGMLSPLDCPRHLPLLVERLSGGRPSTARLLADAAAQLAPAAGGGLQMADFVALLDGTASGDLTARLLRQLLPVPHMRERLTLLSAALDSTAARRLWSLRRPDDDAFRCVREAAEHLDTTRWDLRPWPTAGHPTPFVADRALRALLLLRLRAALAPEDWSQAQRRLRSSYEPPDPALPPSRQQADYLHHSLALGEANLVVRFLHQRFGQDGLHEWLATVNHVCAAPLAPEASVPQVPTTVVQPLELARCPSCTDPTAEHVHLAINRLVRALWRQSDPLTVPQDECVERVESALSTLYEHVVENSTLQRAHREWPKRLREGVQAPDLPISEGPGS
ncbi:hypothetical protein OHV05_00020 [Kitasatospora sp. NBC_00070]|uniref:hypothetical protein n=1 Tax=Kitasatospora sp. NBC_00070 TaxID=2975962 RepID=UPI00325488F7